MKKFFAGYLLLAAMLYAVRISGAAEQSPEDILRKIIICYEVSDYSGIYVSDHGTESYINYLIHVHPDFAQISCLFPPERAGRILYIKKSNMYIKDAESDTLYHRGSGFHSSPLGLEKEHIDLILGNYSAAIEGDTVFIGMNAVVMSIQPNMSDRPGYRLVVEKEHGLILMLSKFSPDNERIFGFRFSEVTFNPCLEPSLTNFDPDSYPIVGREFVDFDSLDELADRFGYPLGQFADIPGGFKLNQKRLLKRHGRDTVHLVYTDGLSTVSFFMRQQRDDEDRENKKDEPAGLQVQRKGPNNIVRGTRGKLKISCIGEQRVETLKEIFEGIK